MSSFFIIHFWLRALSSQYSSARRRRALAPSRPRALLIGFSSLFHRFRSNTHETTQLQQRPTQGFISKRRPHVVEVAAVRDKRSLYVAPPRSKKGKTQSTQTKSQQAQSHSQASSLRPPVTAAPAMSTIPTTVAATATAATSMPETDRPSHRAVVVDNPHWWIRLMLYICCASVNYTGDHH
ncbi:hypothetical protein EV702DRAFT_1157891 [Suillus placidus]|uniref:Uncharacterized protein n=1 Tax=Suillus placidus TaxID=48579 RepID=A0A9P6ZG55_9AGAM|nr:hypothetical protein EV702DRAFT_1157891 [Suillus placidus]